MIYLQFASIYTTWMKKSRTKFCLSIKAGMHRRDVNANEAFHEFKLQYQRDL